MNYVMEYEQETDEKQICLGCGNDSFWVFRDNQTSTVSMFCINCGDSLDCQS